MLSEPGFAEPKRRLTLACPSKFREGSGEGEGSLQHGGELLYER